MAGLLGTLCGLPIIIGVIARGILTEANAIRSPVALGDVSEAHLVEIRDRRGQTLLSGEFRSGIDMLGNTEKDAALTDPRGREVIGEVELDDRIVGPFTTDDRGGVDK